MADPEIVKFLSVMWNEGKSDPRVEYWGSKETSPHRPQTPDTGELIQVEEEDEETVRQMWNLVEDPNNAPIQHFHTLHDLK